jgi:hypothetical protein
VGPENETWGIFGLHGTSTFIASAEVGGEILRSIDFGQTWNATTSLTVNGSISGANGIIYVQADNGLYRSSDTGITWINIGGPRNGVDCRIADFACTIYAFDNEGGVWKNSSAQPFALTTSPLNFGTLSPCETHDTTITFVNTECNPITIAAWTLSQQTKGYNVMGTGGQAPIMIASGDTCSLHITFDGTHTGTLYDTILVRVNASNDSTWRIPIQTIVPPVDSVRFFLQTQSPVVPGQHFNIDVQPDRVVNASKGLTSVSGRFSYSDNDFTFDSITAIAGLQFQKNGPFLSNGVSDVDFSVANANGMTLNPGTPIVQLWLEAMLTDSLNDFIGLDSLLLNGGDPAFENCTLATAASGTSPQLNLACGDSILINAMLGHDLFYAAPPAPNPLGANGDDFVAQINLQCSTNGAASVELFDALGQELKHISYSLLAGQTIPCLVDMQGSPAGCYFYMIRFESPFGTTTSEGSILVIR